MTTELVLHLHPHSPEYRTNLVRLSNTRTDSITYVIDFQDPPEPGAHTTLLAEDIILYWLPSTPKNQPMLHIETTRRSLSVVLDNVLYITVRITVA